MRACSRAVSSDSFSLGERSMYGSASRMFTWKREEKR
jgi:hypothetical protein